MNTVSLRRSLFARLSDSLRLSGLAIVASLVVATSLQAQDAPQSKSASQSPAAPQSKGASQPHVTPPAMTPEQSKQMKEIQGVHAEYMQLQKQLSQIQRDTLEAHPELKKQEQDLHDLILAKMSSNGHNAQDELAEISKLEEKLKNGQASDSERESLMSDYQKKAMAFRKAQTQAMQNPDVKAAQKKLVDNVVKAMKEKDPQTEQLMQQMQQKEEQLSKMLKDAGHTP
jgi:chromosome segregation ATPase